jgi:hypothetical protein
VFVGGCGGSLQLEAGGVKNTKFYKCVGVMITENGSCTDSHFIFGL